MSGVFKKWIIFPFLLFLQHTEYLSIFPLGLDNYLDNLGL